MELLEFFGLIFNRFNLNLEVFGTLLGLLYVICNARQKIITWFFGFACGVVYIIIFYSAKLPGSAILSITFATLNLYGFIKWYRGYANKPLKVSVMKNSQRALLVGFSILLTSLIYTLVYPLEFDLLHLGDCLVSGVSITAAFLAARKKLESWFCWLFVNIIATFVYAKGGLMWTSFLYMIYIVLSVYGYKSWLNSLRQETKTEITDEADLVI